MKLRRLTVKNTVRPLALVGATGMLSLSLIVTMPSNAHALSEGDLLQKAAPRIAGAVKTASPTIAKNLVNNLPGGFAIRALRTLGMLAFSTTDLWMPYITGDLGKAGEDKYIESPLDAQYERHAVDSYTVTGNQIVAGYKFGTGPQQDWYARFGVLVKCKRESDGRIGYRTYGGYQSYGNNGSGGSFSWTWPDVCPGDKLVAFKIGGGQGSTLGQFTPNLNTSDPQPAQMANLVTQYDKATANVVVGGDWDGSGATPFNPNGADTFYQGKSECIDAAGKITWVTGDKIAGNTGGVQLPSCESRGAGHGTGRTQIIMFKPDGTQQPVWDVPVAPTDPETPMCDPGRTSGGCVLSVELDGKGCEAGNVECENWAEIQKNDPNNTRLKCRFGPYTLPMSACGLLEQAYRIGGAIATENNTDGDPATRDDNDLSGQPVPQPAPAPVINAPGTTTGTAPGAPGQTSPSADTQFRQCYPQGWAAFNPVEWVMKPVGCALEYAFVPKPQTVQAQTTRIQDKIKNAGPAKVIAAWEGTFQSVGGGSGCAGPSVAFSMNGYSQSMQPFNACSGGMATAAGISYAVSAVIIVIFGGLGIARAAASAFGFNLGFGKGATSS